MYLELLVCPINPFCVVRHAIRVRERLDPHLDLASDIKNAIAAIQIVRYDWLVVVIRCIAEDGLVPVLQVRLVRNKLREGVPLVLRGDETRAIRANLSGRRVGRFESVSRPAEA